MVSSQIIKRALKAMCNEVINSSCPFSLFNCPVTTQAEPRGNHELISLNSPFVIEPINVLLVLIITRLLLE